jgi:CheY-like chemotaxis protein
MKGDRERFLAAGMDDYIAKPIKRADLAAVITRCMKNNLLNADG